MGASLTGTTRFVEVIAGSLETKVASVHVVQDGKAVPVTLYDTHTGVAPKLFVAFAPPDGGPVRITTLDARGHVLQRARAEGASGLVIYRG